MIKRIIMGLAAALLLVQGAWAQAGKADTEKAAAFIDQLSNEAIGVWTDPALTEDERYEKFNRLLQEGFYLELIARYALGRHARTASEDQLNRYLDVFPDYVIDVFSERIGQYGDERFTVTETVPAGKEDILVRSKIIRPGSSDLLADWRVRKFDGEYRIIDVSLEGISLLRTQRNDFQEKIQDVGIDGLIRDLNQRMGRPAGGE